MMSCSSEYFSVIVTLKDPIERGLKGQAVLYAKKGHTIFVTLKDPIERGLKGSPERLEARA